MLTEYLEEGNAVVVNQSNSLLQICFCGQTGQNLILICWLSSVNRLLTTGCDLILETFQSNLCFVGNFVKKIPKDFFFCTICFSDRKKSWLLLPLRKHRACSLIVKNCGSIRGCRPRGKNF